MLNFERICTENRKFHISKKPIDIDDVNIKKCN